MTSFNTKKSSLRNYIFAGVGVGLLLFAIIYNGSKPKYEIVDLYTDSTDKGKFVFLFVETKSKSKNDLMNWANDVKMRDNLLDMPDQTKPSVLTVYFYNPSDTTELIEEIAKKLKIAYSGQSEFTQKINYSPNGWQYIGHNDSNITKIPKDTVFQTTVFVPKTGYRAYEIIKQIND